MRLRQMTPLLLAVLVAAAGCRRQTPVETMPPTAPPPAPVPTNPPAPPPPPPVDPNAAIERARAELINTLAQEVYFDFDRFDIRAQDRAVLDAKVQILQRHPQVRIRIAGHADERGSDEYNLVLGNNRALAAKAYLVRAGIDAARIEVISYGEERPAVMGSNEDAWARNRRDMFEVIAGREQLGTMR